MGAVVSEYFVLTAAHCFTVEDQKHSIKVSVGKDAVKLLTPGSAAALPPDPHLFSAQPLPQTLTSQG